jgi:hypothetical protein
MPNGELIAKIRSVRRTQVSEPREWYLNLRTGMIARADETRSYQGTHVIAYSAYAALKSQLAEYERALEFYGDEDKHFDADIASDGTIYAKSSVLEDFGKLAREVLAKYRKGE